MPEGDTIALLARRLHTQLAGRTILRSRFFTGRQALVDLAGQRVEEVCATGKHLLIRCVGGPTVHIHLRMDGRVIVRPGGGRGAGGGGTVRFVLDFGDVRVVGERVPVIDVVPRADEARLVGHLGPDLCNPAWGPGWTAEAARRLAGQPDRPVIEALLDQRNLAGIGNIYANEGCFLAGLYPWRPVGDCGDPARLVDMEHRLLAAGVATGAQATTGDRRRGHEHWVYRRGGRPCRRCATPIAVRAGDGAPGRRDTWWCPACQPPG